MQRARLRKSSRLAGIPQFWFLIFDIWIYQAFAWYNDLPGDYTYGETPDPIPNSEAKPVRPMVVLRGESRSSPGIIKAECDEHSAFSFLSRRSPLGTKTDRAVNPEQKSGNCGIISNLVN